MRPRRCSWIASGTGNSPPILGIRPLMLRALSEPWDRPADLAVPAVSLVKLSPRSSNAARAPPPRGRRGSRSRIWPVALPRSPTMSCCGSVLETVPVCDVELERCSPGYAPSCSMPRARGRRHPAEDGLLRFSVHSRGNASSTNTYSMPPPEELDAGRSGCASVWCAPWPPEPPSRCSG